MFRINLFIILFVCFICSSFSTDLVYSPNCTTAINDFSKNGTYNTYLLAFALYVVNCTSGLSVNNTKVTCQDTSNTAVSNFKTFCTAPIYYTLNAKNYTSDTAKWCTVTLTGSPATQSNLTYTIATYACVPIECTKNSTDLTSMGKNAAAAYANPKTYNWNSTTATGTYKCSGFPTWAIILIVIIIIIVAVLIIVAVVVMLRRRTQYQNI